MNLGEAQAGDVVNGADVGMVQGRNGLGLAPKVGQGLRGLLATSSGRNFSATKRRKRVSPALHTDTHTTTELPYDAVVRDRRFVSAQEDGLQQPSARGSLEAIYCATSSGGNILTAD